MQPGMTSGHQRGTRLLRSRPPALSLAFRPGNAAAPDARFPSSQRRAPSTGWIQPGLARRLPSRARAGAPRALRHVGCHPVPGPCASSRLWCSGMAPGAATVLAGCAPSQGAGALEACPSCQKSPRDERAAWDRTILAEGERGGLAESDESSHNRAHWQPFCRAGGHQHEVRAGFSGHACALGAQDEPQRASACGWAEQRQLAQHLSRSPSAAQTPGARDCTTIRTIRQDILACSLLSCRSDSHQRRDAPPLAALKGG